MDLWMDCILDGIKGDVLTLLSLCMLVEKHFIVHLKNNQVWTSFKNEPLDHQTTLQQCDLHLIYLGCGIFTKLIQPKTPLQILSAPGPDVTMVVVGTLQSNVSDLSREESNTLDKLIYSGLGIRLQRPKQVVAIGTPTIKQETAQHQFPQRQNQQLTMLQIQRY